MKPIRKKELSVIYNGTEISINRMANGYFSLTDMVQLFPKKRIRDWLKLKSTKKSIEYLSQPMGNPPYLYPIKTIKGRGTYVNIQLAIDFAMWCNIEFKFIVIGAYIESLDWEEKRDLATFGNNLMNEAINIVKEDPKPRHFSNEARLLNLAVFGHHQKDIRNNATIDQLELLNKLEVYNATLIMTEYDYKERKALLFERSANLSKN